MNATFDTRLQLKYDKINTKYNRLWAQVTDIVLFVLTSFVTYSAAYIGYTLLGNPGLITVFLIKLLSILLPLVIVVALAFGSLVTLLISTGKELHILLNKNKIVND